MIPAQQVSQDSIIMHPMLNIGIRAARAAGDFLIRTMDQIEKYTVDHKGKNDFVTGIDVHAEQTIIEILKKAYPDHAILAEESGKQGDSEYVWIIDPLDGTTNYLHRFPQFAVSIALQHKGITQQAIIYDPLRQELFTATRGDGAYLDNRRIRVSNQIHLEGALLGTGFPYRSMDKIDSYMDILKHVLTLTAGVRRPGSAALDLAYVACGRLDGFWEYGLKKWDVAAGLLLITEAGGLCGYFDGAGKDSDDQHIVAANARMYDELHKLVATSTNAVTS